MLGVWIVGDLLDQIVLTFVEKVCVANFYESGNTKQSCVFVVVCPHILNWQASRFQILGQFCLDVSLFDYLVWLKLVVDIDDELLKFSW